MPNSPPLKNSTTSVPKATYVPLDAKVDPKKPGGAARKANFVHSLNLQPGEVDAVRASKTPAPVAGEAPPARTALEDLLARYEGAPIPSLLPSPAELVNVLVSDLVDFGDGLVSVRQAAVKKATSAAGAQSDADPTVGNAIVAANAAKVATSALSKTGAVPPIGMLYLESLQMMPAGIERGGLLATIPLAPGERAEVVQQEWSAISSEFTSIVTDELTNYSERASPKTPNSRKPRPHK